MRARIVTTRPDGGVIVTIPSQRCVSWMQTGGYWDDQPRGFLDEQIERQIADGRTPDGARRFARALMFGGLPVDEAIAVIAERDCAHLGTGVEIWDVADVPEDRWFRDAWRRSHNGGPIRVDMAAARQVQWRRARQAADDERRSHDLDRIDPDIDWDRIRTRIRTAGTLQELRRIWPV